MPQDVPYPPDATTQDAALKAFVELGTYERHFNGLQHQYRLLGSTWMLAMFGGTGWLLTNTDERFPAGLLVCVIGLAGSVGITQLWNLDHRVYHQLLNACMTEGLRLEDRHPWLPQMRTMMIKARKLSTKGAEHGFSSRVVWFYVTGVLAGLLIATFGACLSIDGTTGRVAASVAGLIIAAIWGRAMIARTGSPVLDEELARRRAAQAEAEK